MLDWYPTVQAALDSCTFDDIVVKLMVDVTLAASLTAPAGRILTIDGNGRHGITRAGATLLDLNVAGSQVVLRDLSLRGNILLNPGVGANTQLTIEDSENLGRVTVQSGPATTLLRVIRSRLVGSDAISPALYVVVADPVVRLEWSYVKSEAGSAAVRFQVVNNNFYSKYSKLYHGSGGAANDPVSRAHALAQTWHSHHNQFNSIPGSGWLTNLIPPAQTMDSVDPGADY